MKRIYIFGAAVVLFSACKPNTNVTTPPTSGDAVFTNYMAVGGSFSSGFGDNSLTVSGQLNSFPQRLFEQLSTVKDGNGADGPFIQPLLTGNNGYPKPKLELSTIDYCDGTSRLGPVTIKQPLDSNGSWHYNSSVNNDQINNISVPGLRVADYAVPGYAAGNAYAFRFYYDPSKRPLDELYSRVYNLHPTFFTLWMGIGDVLGYALAGGQGIGDGTATPAGPLPNLYNQQDITPDQVFFDLYDSIVTALASTSAGGAVLNIPDVSALPYFNVVPSNALVITRQSFADTLMEIYKNDNFDKVFVEGHNQFIIRDNNDKVRQSVPGELILMTIPRDSITCAGWGSIKPIPRQYVLTTDELQNMRNAVTRYNDHIRQLCQLRGLAYVDMNSFFKTLASGMAYNGIEYSTEYISGGAFSLDGVHMNARGNALVANYVINTINNYYHSTVPLTDANKYPGVKFP
jgi:hypothetical protein